MDTLIMLATMSVGCTAGIGIGSAIGYARGQSHGMEAGAARQRQADENWRDLCASSGYAKVLPHGSNGHICSTDCYRKR